MASSRVYRHRPWLVLCTVVALLVAALIGTMVNWVVRAPSIDSIAKAVLLLVPLLALEAFLLLTWRMRTTVDDVAVTQQWITKSFRIPLAEITDVEPANQGGRWFIRLHCTGGRTFEVIPCHRYLWHALADALGPPRAMRAALHDIEERMATTRAV